MKGPIPRVISNINSSVKKTPLKTNEEKLKDALCQGISAVELWKIIGVDGEAKSIETVTSSDIPLSFESGSYPSSRRNVS